MSLCIGMFHLVLSGQVCKAREEHWMTCSWKIMHTIPMLSWAAPPVPLCNCAQEARQGMG